MSFVRRRTWLASPSGYVSLAGKNGSRIHCAFGYLVVAVERENMTIAAVEIEGNELRHIVALFVCLSRVRIMRIHE